MTPPTIAVYLSEHGFGHGVRTMMLLEGLLVRRPDLRVVLATRLPAWLHEGVRQIARDEARGVPPPMIQTDSLAVDHEATTTMLRHGLEQWDADVAEQRRYLQSIGACLVYSDVPALPLEAAAAAGIVGVALGNFTWDWIYRGYADLDPVYQEAANRSAAAYRAARLYLRTPPSPAPPDGMRSVDVPWLVRHPQCPPERVRKALGVAEQTPLVLLSFGGHAGVPVRDLAGSEWATRVRLVAGRQLAAVGDGIQGVDEDGLAARGIGYLDLVRAADVVVSKPGYGIIADCLSTGTRLVYLARPEFPEAAILEPHMKQQLNAVAVAPEHRSAAGIAAAVDQALSRPAPTPTCPLDGVERAVDQLLQWLPTDD